MPKAMTVFEFKDNKTYEKAIKSLNRAIKEQLGSGGHFDFNYQPEHKTIHIDEKHSDIIKKWFEKNDITNYELDHAIKNPYKRSFISTHIRKIAKRIK